METPGKSHSTRGISNIFRAPPTRGQNASHCKTGFRYPHSLHPTNHALYPRIIQDMKAFDNDNDGYARRVEHPAAEFLGLAEFWDSE